MYQFQPECVETPIDRMAVLRVLENSESIVPRGAGTSLVGQSIGSGTILDCSRYLNRVLDINVEEGWVRVEPGMVCGDLNSYLKPYGYCFAPDPATLNRATIGGMIANNASVMRSVLYGMTIDHVLELELALADGFVLQLGSLTQDELESKCSQEGREGQIYRGIRDLLTAHAHEPVFPIGRLHH